MGRPDAPSGEGGDRAAGMFPGAETQQRTNTNWKTSTERDERGETPNSGCRCVASYYSTNANTLHSCRRSASGVSGRTLTPSPSRVRYPSSSLPLHLSTCNTGYRVPTSPSFRTSELPDLRCSSCPGPLSFVLFLCSFPASTRSWPGRPSFLLHPPRRFDPWSLELELEPMPLLVSPPSPRRRSEDIRPCAPPFPGWGLLYTVLDQRPSADPRLASAFVDFRL